MYDRPWNRQAHETLWSLTRDALRDHGIAAPDTLDQDIAPPDGWGRSDLVLGQICNLPYRARFRDRLTVIGTADHRLPGIPPGHYASVFVVRQDDPAMSLIDCDGHALALNDPMSQSGWGAVRAAAQRIGIGLHPHVVTGSHRASIEAVARGDADLAAIDIVAWRIDNAACETPPGLRVIGQSAPSPGMSFVTAGHKDPGPYRAALAGAFAALRRELADALQVHGLVVLPASDYDLDVPEPAEWPA